MQKAAVEAFREAMRERLAAKPEIADFLVPSFAVGCRRTTPGPGYLEALEQHLPEVLEAAGADLLFYQAGVDALAEDALGRLSLSHAGLRERDRRVLQAAWHRGLAVVLTLGGGYARPLEATLEAHVGTYEVARERYG